MDGLQEGGDLALGGKGREGIAERVKVFPELLVVLRLPGIEPAAAGEEPVARVAEWGEKAAYQDNVISASSSSSSSSCYFLNNVHFILH